MTDSLDDSVLMEITRDIAALRNSLGDAESRWAPEIAQVDEHNVRSAQNLVHYWAIRQFDLRDLQHRLAMCGLSSLGRSEPHVQATLEMIARAADALAGRSWPACASAEFEESARLLRTRSARLFGAEPAGRQTRIMVTLPSEAATNATLVETLVERGMDLARINCAHDDPAAWAAMITNVRKASASAGRECRVAMDLAGPKLRTGPLADGPAVVKVHPARDMLGHIRQPGRCWLGVEGVAPPPEAAELPVVPLSPREWLDSRAIGETITCRDTRGAHRRFAVESTAPSGVLAWTIHTAYVVPGTVFEAADGTTATVGALPPIDDSPVVRRGDLVVLTRDCAPGSVDPAGNATIGCTLPAAFDHVAQGHAVRIDDGKISGKVLEHDRDSITVLVTAAGADGSRLRAGKGINLPDTVLPVPALTEDDREALSFIVAHADIVEASFVRSATDVDDLLAALDQLGAGDLGIVVKIETAQGFNNLPAILLAALRRPAAGVMVARGDLAVECGYERLAELQEEILWLCESAHLPVIWATQVLDQLARTGAPSRAEITDAAMGERAECVMLNKGPHIVEAVSTLDDILARMGGHHYKKTALMRPLRSWQTPDEPHLERSREPAKGADPSVRAAQPARAFRPVDGRATVRTRWEGQRGPHPEEP